MARQGRTFQQRLVALARPGDDGRVEILAPGVGLWRDGPEPGALVRPGDSLGQLEVLGVLYRIDAPEQARGVVVAPRTDNADSAGSADSTGNGRNAGNPRIAVRETRARQPVAYGQRMFILDPAVAAAPGQAAAASATSEQPEAEGLVFRAPMSGRFYSRSSPDKPSLVQVGDIIHTGTTVCLLEVMKTFNRVHYGGDDLPDTARIIDIRPRDEDDLDMGDIILVLEPA